MIPSSIKATTTSNLKILVADDELVNRRFLKAAMEDWGDIYLASDGEEAVGMVEENLKKQESFDVIVLDIMMPKMDGHQTLKIIRQMENNANLSQGKKSKIIMITAKNDRQNMIRSFDAGCEYYLVKPIFPRELDEIMQEILSEKVGVNPAV